MTLFSHNNSIALVNVNGNTHLLALHSILVHASRVCAPTLVRSSNAYSVAQDYTGCLSIRRERDDPVIPEHSNQIPTEGSIAQPPTHPSQPTNLDPSEHHPQRCPNPPSSLHFSNRADGNPFTLKSIHESRNVSVGSDMNTGQNTPLHVGGTNSDLLSVPFTNAIFCGSNN